MPSTKHRCALTCVSANEKPKVLKDKVWKEISFSIKATLIFQIFLKKFQ